MKHEFIHIPGDDSAEVFGAVLEIVASFATCIATQTSVQAPLDLLAHIFGASDASLKRLTTPKDKALVRQITESGKVWIRTAQGYRIQGKTAPPTNPQALIFSLDVRSGGVDLIELWFEGRFIQLPVSLTQHLARTLAITWSRKLASSDASIPLSKASAQMPDILSADNPYGLTGAETRVCHALRNGLRAAEIAAHLGVGIATVRSHLSKIYSKTALPTQLAVMHRLTATQHDTGIS